MQLELHGYKLWFAAIASLPQSDGIATVFEFKNSSDYRTRYLFNTKCDIFCHTIYCPIPPSTEYLTANIISSIACHIIMIMHDLCSIIVTKLSAMC